MLYDQHTEGRMLTAAFIVFGWIGYATYFTSLWRTNPILTFTVFVALVALLRTVASGPSAKYLPEGADSTEEFIKRDLDARPYAGRVAVVTGANRNIGWEITRSLSQLGAHVIMVDMESEEMSAAARAKIQKQDPKASLVSVQLDLSNFDMIGETAKKIVEIASQFKGGNKNNKKECIDFLVNNAGMAELNTRFFTRQGYNKCFQVNHLGPYIFTEWLLPHVISNGPNTSRIVNTASCAHTWWNLYPFSVDVSRSIIRGIEIMNDPTIAPYPQNSAYALSKFCNLIHASHLAKREQFDKKNIKCASYHPGAVFTDIWRVIPYPFKYVTDVVMAIFFKNAYEGHQTALHLLTAPHIINGQFYADCAPFRPRDEALNEAVWNTLEEWTRNAVKKWLP